MENLHFEFTASTTAAPLTRQVLAGVVGSGDLEVLIEAHPTLINVTICTSVNGMTTIWQALMQRLFGMATLPPMHIELNDFGASPGVARLRIEQALDDLGLNQSLTATGAP